MNAYVNESIARQRHAEIERRAARRPIRDAARESRGERGSSLVLRLGRARRRGDATSFGHTTRAVARRRVSVK